MSRRSFLRVAGLAAVSTCFTPPASQAGGYRGEGIPESLSDKLKELHDKGENIRQVVLAPNNGWLVLFGTNGFWERGIPTEATAKLFELHAAKKILQHVSFSPDGGYIIFYTEDNRFQRVKDRGLPTELINKLKELIEARSNIKQVAFTKNGGWVILHGFNGFAYKNISDSVVERLKQVKRHYHPFRSIAFTEDGGAALLYGSNGYATHEIPAKAGEALDTWHNDGKELLSVTFFPGGGWLLLQNYDSATKYWITRALDGSDAFPPIHAYAHDFGEAHNRNAILAGALNVLHTRFRELRVAKNSYEISREAYFVNDEYWKLCNVEAHPTYGPKELLWYQLEILRLPNSEMEDDDEGPPFPELHLYPYFEQDDSWAKAFLNRVIVKYVNPQTTRRTGDFVLFLNQWHLGSGGEGSELPAWATVMGHELLHNLGHEHGPGDYTDGRQINCFHRAVYCDGGYDGKKEVPGFG
jgi:hypothetical protein